MTTNETFTPLWGVPLALATVAVTVCAVPTELVAEAGATLRFGTPVQVLRAVAVCRAPSTVMAALIVSSPSFVPVYVKATMPAASVAHPDGTHVPVAPALTPVTTNETETSARGAPLALVTVAVDGVRGAKGLVAVAGLTLRFGASTTIPEPAIRT